MHSLTSLGLWHLRSQLIWNTPTSNHNRQATSASQQFFLRKNTTMFPLVSLLKTKKDAQTNHFIKFVRTSVELSRTPELSEETLRLFRRRKVGQGRLARLWLRPHQIRPRRAPWLVNLGIIPKKQGGSTTVTSHLRGLWRCFVFFFGGGGKK